VCAVGETVEQNDDDRVHLPRETSAASG
jgi:hypothetical protein